LSLAEVEEERVDTEVTVVTLLWPLLLDLKLNPLWSKPNH
jgi:hypothetical protein